MKWDFFIIVNYSTFIVSSSVHSSFLIFGLRRRTNHAIRGNPIITTIYWRIQLLFDQLDILHDLNNVLDSFIPDFVDTLSELNRSFDDTEDVVIEFQPNGLDDLDQV